LTAHRSAGFTLMETLVSLVVLGFIVAGLAQGLRFGVSAWDRQVRGIDHDSALDSTDRTLRALLARMMPGDDPHQPTIQGNDHRLLFTAELPENAPARLADLALAVDSEGRLVLRWTPHLHARRLTPAITGAAVLLPGVKAVRFAYFQRGIKGLPPGWVDRWQGIAPPELVRLHLTFADPARRWPDVIVAPMRETDDED
jgi:general secretion pathway protein J